VGVGLSDPDEIADPELFERLRAVRKRLADAEGVPAYIVFSDAVLRGMARMRPRSPEELRLVAGVGPVKLERYGDAFLEELKRGE
jgi:ATP-dependent DNA helicase RecQ